MYLELNVTILIFETLLEGFMIFNIKNTYIERGNVFSYRSSLV